MKKSCLVGLAVLLAGFGAALDTKCHGQTLTRWYAITSGKYVEMGGFVGRPSLTHRDPACLLSQAGMLYQVPTTCPACLVIPFLSMVGLEIPARGTCRPRQRRPLRPILFLSRLAVVPPFRFEG